VDFAVARAIAHDIHTGQCTRHGAAMSEHIERVGAAVPDTARTVAFLHDVLERSPTSHDELVAGGLTGLEADALDLLTRAAGESYELYVLRIAAKRGPAGRLARIVKIADLDDHIAARYVLGDPPYGWARRRIVIAQEVLGERGRAAAAGAQLG
jgi:hypothetical protein